MKFSVLTLFPEMFEGLKTSIIGRAEKKNLIELDFVNIRDFSKDKHKKVDDTPYGGGAGMVIQPDIVYDAYKFAKTDDSYVVYLSPQGKVLNQDKIRALSEKKHIILLCRTLWRNWPKSYRWDCRWRDIYRRLCFDRRRNTSNGTYWWNL